jgi:hypothetical protein
VGFCKNLTKQNGQGTTLNIWLTRQDDESDRCRTLLIHIVFIQQL